MTHEDLQNRLLNTADCENIECVTEFNALRAVVELHKPKSVTNIWTNEVFTYCSICCTFGDLEETSREIPYPCPTIQAIEKELF